MANVPVNAEVIVVRITDLVPYETGVTVDDESVDDESVVSDSVEPESVDEPEPVEFEPVGMVVLLPASPGKTSPASHCWERWHTRSRLAT